MKIALAKGICAYLKPSSYTQMASQSVQTFLQASQLWRTDTNRPCHSVSRLCCSAKLAMWPDNNSCQRLCHLSVSMIYGIINFMRLRPLTRDVTHTHPFNGPLSGTTRVSRYQKGKPISILLKQETVSVSGISWAICKSAPCSRQITTPATHRSVFYRPDALPAAQPTDSKHWRQKL